MATSGPVAAFRVRDAGEGDLPAIQAIYGAHVRDGLGSFEETPPDLAEMTRRFHSLTQAGLPYLVAATDSGDVLGYAYAGPYRPRPAYRFTLEDSVYVAAACQTGGVGAALLRELLRRAEDLGYRQMMAVIGDSGNRGSIALHEKLGFTPAGLMRSVGFKAGRWVDVVVLQRAIGPGDSDLPEEKA